MSKKQIAIITGANGGFGEEFVKLLVQYSGVDEIWAVARNEEKLRRLSEKYGEKIRTLALDLSERKSYAAIEKYLQESDACVRFLVNNAGFAKFCSYGDISVEESLNMVDLNVNAVVALGLVCIPFMAQGSHIINIASQAAFFPLPYQNIYSSTKAFVRNYTRALNVELKEKGITATAVCPGWMKTALFDRGIIGAQKGTNHFSCMVTPDVVAKKAMNDALKGKDISVYGLYVKCTHLLSKLLPQRMMMKVWLGQQKIR
jgi:short-subunit dehydrogenase